MAKKSMKVKASVIDVVVLMLYLKNMAFVEFVLEN